MSDEVEDKARTMGWLPEEDFRGDKKNWVDAETYVKRGEEFVPFLKANNRKLESKLSEVTSEVTSLKETLAQATETIEALKEFNSERNRENAEVLRKQILKEISEAREAGDVEKEETLRDTLAETREAIKEAKVTPKEKEEVKPANPEDSPEWKAWLGDNDWFNTDRTMRAVAAQIASDNLNNAEFVKMKPKERWDWVRDQARKELKRDVPKKVISDVEGGGNRGSESNGGKNFSDLPKEAKDACDRWAEKLVKKGGAWETKEAYRKHYAEQYQW